EAGADLLNTYDAERRPVGTFTTEQAYSRYVTRTAPYLGTEGMEPVAPDLNIELGYRYDSPALCHDGDPRPRHEHPRDAHASAGTRALQAWVVPSGERVWPLDLFGSRFVILGGANAQSWIDAAVAAC